MLSSLFAHAQRILVICWFSVMVFVVSLPPHSSLFFRRRDQPRLLPDKIMRSRDRLPTVHGVGSFRIPGHDRSSPNASKQRENLLPSSGIRADETRQFGVGDLHDDPHTGQMRPIRVTRTPEATNVRPGCDPHEVKLLRNHPRLIRLVAYNIIHIARYWPRHGERRCKDDTSWN